MTFGALAGLPVLGDGQATAGNVRWCTVRLRTRAWGTWPGWSRTPLVTTLLALAVFATGVGPRPAGAWWGPIYDLVLYNVVNLGSAVVCVQAARRGSREAVAWWALAAAQITNVLGNLWYSLVIAPLPQQPPTSLADVCYLAFYPGLYIALVALIRARVHRFHASMWLDGLIGTLGATAVAIAVLLAPALQLTDGSTVAVAVALAYPVADVVLLALLVAVSAVLGLRRDPVLWLLGAGVLANLLGDILNLDLQATGTYSQGGPLDLTWLGGMALMALAADRSLRSSVPAANRDEAAGARVGWRMLAVPMACNIASLAVLAAGWGDRYPAAAAWCAIACVGAGFVRTMLTFREVRSFHEFRAQARTDELTGLPNRRALLEAAEQVLASATAADPAALLLLDLDGFKDVNDSLGHHVGDELLQQIGPRLEEAALPGQLAARLGGDEFAVLLPRASLDDALSAAARIREALARPIAIEGIRVHIGASIGVATAPVPAAGVREMLRCADIAMYAAKSSRDGVRAYVPEPHDATRDRLQTMEDLRDAFGTEQLLVHLQPQVRLADQAVVGVEALVRWQHPRLGLLSPATILPAAEQARLLLPLADAVLDLALTATARWWPTHRVPVSVNLAAANICDVDLPEKVSAALRRHGLPAQALTLELVEDTLMADPERARLTLSQLRCLGVRTSIDDYGAGYSSLAYLRRLPADELKLDRSLTQDLDTDPAAATIVEHTVALAHALGLTLVAEGVEDLDSARLLASLGCDIAQGFAVARPMPVDHFLAWLEEDALVVLTPSASSV